MDTAAAIELFRSERQHLLDEGNRLYAAGHALRDGTEAGLHRAFDLYDHGEVMVDRYRQLLPDVPIARCPRTDELLTWPIDTIEIDGWFWKYNNPTRRHEDLPLTHLALTGSMRVVDPAPWTHFKVEPGPGAPYAIPRILEHPEIVAVIAQVPIGRHTGWPINYFGSRSTGEPMVNEWGSYMHQTHDPDGKWLGWAAREPLYEDELDFELTPWIESNKLYWITPGDDAMTLKTGLANCPYVGVDGPRVGAQIENGKIYYPPHPT